jgi:hypothetical protein
MVRQRQADDCVVAAVAGAAGASYAAVKRVCGTTRGGLERHEVEWLLGQFGKWKRSRPRKDVTAKRWAAAHPTARAVLLVGSRLNGSDKVHALSAVDGVAFDPSDGSDDHPMPVGVAYVLRQ